MEDCEMWVRMWMKDKDGDEADDEDRLWKVIRMTMTMTGFR